MKILAVVVVGIAFLAVGEAAECDNQRFQKCVDSFARDLGLPGMPQDIKQLLLVLAALAQQGPAGLQQICKALQNAKTCFDDQYDTCISVKYLTSIGQPKETAIVIVVLVNDVNYACTTAADVFNKNAACISDVGQKNMAQLKKCATDYQENLNKDPCKYSQTFIDCISDPFKNGCPSVVAQTMCETLKPGYDKGIQGCSITCSKQSGGSAPITKSIFGGIISLVLCALYYVAF